MINQPPQDNPYAAPEARIVDQLPQSDLVLAERGTRLGAVFLDGLIVVLVYLPGLLLISLADDNKTMKYVGIALMVIVILGLLAYNCVLLHRNGQTIAKKMLGIKVVRRDGSPVSLGRFFALRFLPVSLLGAIPLVGGLVSLTDALMIFGEERRCLHDQFADTIVIKT
ncbi:MAG TPA: RDD family protein [Luteimonas sp.]|nr:RDD family protein [Luteimonas sp.]